MLKPSDAVSDVVLRPPPPIDLHPNPQTRSAPMANNEQEQWTRVRKRLRAEVGEDIFSSWFMRMDLETVDDDTVQPVGPNALPQELDPVALRRARAHVLAGGAAGGAGGRPAVRSAARASLVEGQSPKQRRPRPYAPRRRKGGRSRSASAPVSVAHEALGGSPLDPRLTFETFVVGRSNTLAHAAAKQVAAARRGDPVMFNPLYIHAGVGLGKTHLLQAIAWAGNASGERKVLYLTAEKFMYGFVSALKSQTALAFKEALRAIDVLVIDDLQFLQGKSTQAEFCHTLNALIDAGRQVVVAADRPPADLESLDERVRSRLAGGLVVEIGSLDEELRLEILKSRAAAAPRASPGLRRAGAGARLHRQDRDPQWPRPRRRAQSPARPQQAHRPCGDHGHGGARGARPRPAAGAQAGQDRGHPAHGRAPIQRQPLRPAVVAPHRQCGASRARSPCTSPRRLTLRSLPEIGRRFGGRDHTTVLHAVRKIEGLVDSDSALAEEIELLKRVLQE